MSQKVEVDGRLKDTSRPASRSTTSPSTSTTGSSGGPRRSPLQAARDIQIARHVRPLVGWTQTERLRRLAYALRPLIDQGLAVHDIAAELHSWYLNWRPAKPAAYITAQLRARHDRDEHTPQPALDGQPDAGTTVDPQGNAAWREWCEEQQARAALEALITSGRRRTDDDRRHARYKALRDPRIVLDHYADDPDDAIDLYGVDLTARIAGLAASTSVQLG